MKIEINNRKEFAKVISDIAKAVPLKPHIPILECVKIESSENSIILTASDLENTVVKTFVCECDSGISTCINAKDMKNIVSSITNDCISIEVGERMATIKHGRGSFELPTSDTIEYPSTQNNDTSTRFEIESEILFNLLIKARRYVSNEELRPVMTGVYFQVKDGIVEVCGTDSNKLYFNKYATTSTADVNFIATQKSISLVIDAINRTNNVSISVSERFVHYDVDGTTIISRLIDGRYPNYNSVIPKYNSIEIKLNRADFQDSIKRCVISASAHSGLLKIAAKGDLFGILGEDIDFSKKAVDNIECESSGEITFGIKASSLSVALESISSEVVVIKAESPSRPILFFGEGNDSELSLIMPMLLN